MKDRLGFEVGKPLDEKGRPLSIHSHAPTEAYRAGWDEVFGKAPKVESLCHRCTLKVGCTNVMYAPPVRACFSYDPEVSDG